MRIIDSLLMELDQETASTRKVLERVPEEHLKWKPHQKSMTLGQLALHIAIIPGAIAGLVSQEGLELPGFREDAQPATKAEILQALEGSHATAKESLGKLDDQKAMATWRLTRQGKELMAIPKIGVVRVILLNHLYHHRGQMTVYLRLLNIPLPAVYGSSADESAFGA
ncbi:MAG: hypothetical protein A3F83_13075 [Candidatus Glassbacteria bacterium RIFCSPLOWO2_12_FULL_58_11]|uniref:DinB-like domain-containing protein n=1 Tax=Candidatus Glassbacteria bacterium RIFCSPLOWO2_12_FULL_58_11 TaxID=1817867 RepID=A0A1F5Z2E4_9BACT|nr:MAG: hypothetical protein A3F83_13075 [Candidatus Glassbacteria bacterium RIFCSPLOWO2_12_FULL_58_11]